MLLGGWGVCNSYRVGTFLLWHTNKEIGRVTTGVLRYKRNGLRYSLSNVAFYYGRIFIVWLYNTGRCYGLIVKDFDTTSTFSVSPPRFFLFLKDPPSYHFRAEI